MFEAEKSNATTRVRVRGNLTAGNADEFRRFLQELVESGENNLTIDLAGVEMIDSKGLAVFIVCYQTLSLIGGSLTVVTDSDDLKGLFHVMRMDEHFTVCGSC